MRKRGLLIVLLSFCPLAFAQPDSNSITVSASNNATLQPDQAIFAVSVQSGMNTSLDDVVAALQGSGITAANLSSVSTLQLAILTLQWTFNLPVPLANTPATIASLNTLQQNIAKLNNGLTLSFSLVGTRISQQLAQSQTCSLSGLIASATTQAQSLASAAGLTLGSIAALSSPTSTVVSNAYAAAAPCAITVSFGVTSHVGQFPPRTLTISANRATYLQPDEVVFGVSVISGVATTEDQIVAALSGLGIASSNLTGVNTTSAPPNLQWTFNLAVPLSNLTATISSLAKLQQTIAQNNSGLTLTFNVNGTEVSQQLQQSQSCSNADLIADATTQAQKLAAAAGLTLGPILQLSNASLTQAYGVPTLVAEIYPANFVVNSYIGFVSLPLTCSLVVEFQLPPQRFSSVPYTMSGHVE